MKPGNATSAIVWEEWGRVRRWWPWGLAGMAAYIAILMQIEAGLRRNLPLDQRTLNGFMAWERASKDPPELFLLPMILCAAAVFAVIGSYDSARGLSVGLPWRYLALPVPAWRTALLQFACRLVLGAPVALMLAVTSTTLGLAGDLVLSVWALGMLVGVGAPVAAALWWPRLGWVAIFIWVLAPVALWVAGAFDYALLQDTPFLQPAAALALLGVVSGCALLARGGALEAAPLPACAAGAMLRSRPAPKAFASPAAAVRWFAGPRYLPWSLPVTAVIALLMAAYVMSVEAPMVLAMNWLPWTPGYIKPLALTQMALVRWGYYATSYFPFVLAAAAGLHGLLFLRTEILHRPIHLRLPISSWGLARSTGLAALLRMAQTAALGTALFLGTHYVASSVNVGTQYVWPVERLDGQIHVIHVLDGAYSSLQPHPLGGPYLDRSSMWMAGAHDPFSGEGSWLQSFQDMARGLAVTASLHVAFASMAYWQILWGLVPFCWDTGAESLILPICAAAFAVRAFRRRQRVCTAFYACAALLLGVNYALLMVYIEPVFANLNLILVAALLPAWLLLRVTAGVHVRKALHTALAVLLGALLCIAFGFSAVSVLEAFHVDLAYLYRGMYPPTRVAVGAIGIVIVPMLSFWGITALRRHE